MRVTLAPGQQAQRISVVTGTREDFSGVDLTETALRVRAWDTRPLPRRRPRPRPAFGRLAPTTDSVA